MNTANINSLWADVLVEELIRQGIDYFCISPGFRSTPLTAAIATRKERGQMTGHTVVHFDERGAAFHAQGYGRATGQPAVLVCTSGTAAANYYPAIIEASQENVPLIALTADRPPELRDTAANQTIDQLRLYGKYARWFSDLPCPDTESDPLFLLTTVDKAVAHSLGRPPGPVHLNCPFREPLVPLDDGSDLSAHIKQLENWYQSGQPLERYTQSAEKPSGEDLSTILETIKQASNGFILVGRLQNKSERNAVKSLAQLLGWPVLADITSGLRLDPSEEIVHHYDLLLASEFSDQLLRPDTVVHLGGRFVSKRLLQFIERTSPAHYVVVNDSPARLDPADRVTRKIECDITFFCRELTRNLSGHPGSDCLTRWRAYDDAARGIIDDACGDADRINEASTAHYLSRHLPDQSGLFLASSMPIRDMDMYAGTSENDVIIAANRGASGIDGTIASATGFAEGLNRPVTLLIGDLAFLHDLNSLALMTTGRNPITAIVLNNNGGRIFEYLPVTGLTDIFEKYFATPHGLDFERVVAMFDLPYSKVESLEELAAAYDTSQQSESSCVIEVILDNARSLSVYQSIQSRISTVMENLD